ncbi:MAG: ABC transporter permease [Promethearchaeota archaeon]|nr:MAG: ABC transporter permease [Candidatus Lokiarchaeota archaeon]
MRSESLRNIWMLSKKNMTLYVKRGPVLIFGLMFPFFLVISWILGRTITIHQIFIGIVAMTSFFTSTAISPVILPIETREKSLERLLSAPVSFNEILLGIIIASTLYSIIITSIISIIFILPFPTLIASPFSYIIIFIGISLMGVLGSLLGLLVSSKPTDMTSDIMVLMNLIKFPLLFIGGVFIPLSSLPSSIAILYFFSPLTFVTEMLRSSVDQTNLLSNEVSILFLIGWIALFLTLNYVLHRKTMPKRFSEAASGPKMKKMRKK